MHKVRIRSFIDQIVTCEIRGAASSFPVPVQGWDCIRLFPGATAGNPLLQIPVRDQID